MNFFRFIQNIFMIHDFQFTIKFVFCNTIKIKLYEQTNITSAKSARKINVVLQ